MTTSNTTQSCMICGGSAPTETRIDLQASFLIGSGLIVGLLAVGAFKVMRDVVKGADQERDTLRATQKAADAAIKVGMVS